MPDKRSDQLCVLCRENPPVTTDTGEVVSNICDGCHQLVLRFGGVQAALEFLAMEKRKRGDAK